MYSNLYARIKRDFCTIWGHFSKNNAQKLCIFRKWLKFLKLDNCYYFCICKCRNTCYLFLQNYFQPNYFYCGLASFLYRALKILIQFYYGFIVHVQGVYDTFILGFLRKTISPSVRLFLRNSALFTWLSIGFKIF